MVVGHKKQLQILQRLGESGKIPHALLFAGPEKLGKKTIALEFSQTILRQNPFNHPDFIFMSPGESGEYKIDEIRELVLRLSLKPVLAEKKVVVLDEVHLMNSETQNCFLKTLEEPRGDTLLILISRNADLLLPTILSRCQLIKFYPVGNEEMEKYLRLQKTPEKEMRELQDVSSGRPGVMMDLLANPQKIREREKIIAELDKISKSPLFVKFQYVKDLAEKENLAEILGIWLSYLRKKFFGQKSDILPKEENILKVLQNTISLISSTNVSKRLALEILVMEF